MKLLLIRHAPTDWNIEKRLQGQRDIPLSQSGRRWLNSWRVPRLYKDYKWFSSPLQRALETARALHNGPVTTDSRLLEMNFGDWEGLALPVLRQTLGAKMKANEDQGLDFHPPGGESPRQLQTRLLPLLAELAATGQDSVLVSHHGVMRAIMALAFKWDMTGKPPLKIHQGYGYLFSIKNNLNIMFEDYNINLSDPGDIG